MFGCKARRLRGNCLTSTEVLKQYFGYDSFRNGQDTLINNILNGQDVLGIMPTGAGKSICFQVPGLMFLGVTIIISPLISLMKDQVDSLIQNGISAAFINSSLTENQIKKAISNTKNGMYRMLYIAPERLISYEFLQLAASIDISLLVIDEAHCISQWGQDFRPSYTKIPEFLHNLKVRPPVAAFTATATPIVQDDIASKLALDNPSIFLSSFDRQNLYFEVKKPSKKFDDLMYFLKDKKNLSGIIYCSTRKNVEELCEKLRHQGYNSSRYHAGLSDIEKKQNQENFIHDNIQIMVATNAFGMGIDKPNVSFVVHYNMPMDIESYYQEAGRAGRDGQLAHCLLLYSPQDTRTNLWLIENSIENENLDNQGLENLKDKSRKRLYEMELYCKTNDCLRNYILKYFGEKIKNECKNCSNCSRELEAIDITIEAQKIISCVVRMKERYGANMVVDVLKGAKNKRLLGFGLQNLSTYGISKDSEHDLHEIIDYLIISGYLTKTHDEFPKIKISSLATKALKSKESIIAKLPHKTKQSINFIQESSAKLIDKDLLVYLKELRLIIARKKKLPAYVIFNDSSLVDMCTKLPKTIDEMLTVFGVGSVKAEQYGNQFLKAIADYSKSKSS